MTGMVVVMMRLQELILEIKQVPAPVWLLNAQLLLRNKMSVEN